MTQLKIRKPAFSGRFYPSDPKELSKMLDEILLHEKQNINSNHKGKTIYGAVVPHAGYMFSANHAVHFFELVSKLEKKIDTFIIINPNHTGHGDKISMDSHQFWNTPYGDIEQDMGFIESLGFPFSDIAHEHEHSGEVMLPLLQYFVKYVFKVVMITFSQPSTLNARDIAKKIKDTEQKLNRNVLVVASSDFTHFKNVETGIKSDNLVLEQINNQDIYLLNEVVKQSNISVCGYGPIMCLMEYSSLKGAYTSEVISRGHSGKIVPSNRVVDYITILFSKNENC